MSNTSGVLSRRFKNRDEWREARLHSLGASEIASLFGMGFKSALQVWADHTIGPEPTEGEEVNYRFELGLAAEPLIAKWAGGELGEQGVVKRFDPPVIFTRPGLVERTHATPDAALVSAEEERLIAPVELKTWYSDSDWPIDGTIHPYVLIQVQHQMLMMDLQEAYVAVMFGMAQSFRIYKASRHDEFCREIIKKVNEFWSSVEARQPPEPTGHPGDTQALKMLYPKSTGEVVNLAGEEWPSLVRRYEKYQEVKKRIEAKVEEIKQRAQNEMQSAEIGVVAGCSRAFSWANTKRVEKPRPGRVTEYRVFRLINTPKGD